MARSSAPLLELDGISKRFGATTALDNVSISVCAGEVHMLLGENGAGKSTLVNILAGQYAPDSGVVTLDGVELRSHSPEHAAKAGIRAVFQELSLVGSMSVVENLHLGQESELGGVVLDRRRMERATTVTLGALGLAVSPRRRVDSLSRAEQQLIEVGKALLHEAKVVIFDEPTSALESHEVGLLFQTIARLKAEGKAVIYITHRMPEIRQIGDRVTVLRDGRVIATTTVESTDDEALIEFVTGRRGRHISKKRADGSPPTALLEVDDLTVGSSRVRNLSLSVGGGEIVGIAGLVGAGKSDVGRAVVGLMSIRAGAIRVGGVRIQHPRPHEMLAHGVVYCSSDRRGEGIFPCLTVRENITLAGLSSPGLTRWGILRRRAERDIARDVADRMQVRPPDIEQAAGRLSGGNQQKIVLSRALVTGARLLILDDPTAGIDVGGRSEIYELLQTLCASGAGILLITSDLQELEALCTRAYVMHDGQVVSELSGEEVTEANALSYFFDNAEASVAS